MDVAGPAIDGRERIVELTPALSADGAESFRRSSSTCFLNRRLPDRVSFLRSRRLSCPIHHLEWGIDTRQRRRDAGNRRHEIVSDRLTEEYAGSWRRRGDRRGARAGARAARLPARPLRRDLGPHGAGHAARAAARRARRAGADARPAARLRLPAARHRHDRRLERDADEAGRPLAGRDRRDPRAPLARRAHRRAGAGARRRRAAGDRVPSRAVGRLRAIRAACAASRSRSPRASSRSSTRSTR